MVVFVTLGTISLWTNSFVVELIRMKSVLLMNATIKWATQKYIFKPFWNVPTNILKNEEEDKQIVKGPAGVHKESSNNKS